MGPYNAGPNSALYFCESNIQVKVKSNIQHFRLRAISSNILCVIFCYFNEYIWCLLTPALNGGKEIFETSFIKAGVNGAGVKLGPLGQVTRVC